MKLTERILAVVLCVCMLVTMLPISVLGYLVEGQDTANIESITTTDSEGNTTTEDYDSSWETVFPYGAFAFGEAESQVDEGGAAVTIPVYRLGGTKGRVTVQIEYQPSITKLVNDEPTYAYAASGKNDVKMQVEDAMPIAQYQPVGQAVIKASKVVPAINVAKTTNGVDGSTCYYLPDVTANTYQWQVLVCDDYGNATQDWTDIADATEAEALLPNDKLYTYDFRCIYTTDEGTFCSMTVWSQEYEEVTETLPTKPDGFVNDTTQTFSDLVFTGEYTANSFPVTFADGEWVKDIRVTAIDDSEPELEKFGTFTMIDHEGGALYDSASTHVMMVEDNDPFTPSELGFTVTEGLYDQADGEAVFTVKRTGGLAYVVQVDYATADGTALAGRDYASTSGSLVFAGDVDEIDIKVPLIASEERAEERAFTLSLTAVRGGGTGNACTIGENSSVAVSLYSSGMPDDGAGLNLATILAGTEGEDVSGSVSVDSESVLPEAQTVTGEQVTEDTPELTAIYSDGVAKGRTYVYPEGLNLRRNSVGGSDYKSNYWCDWESICAADGAYSSYDISGSANLLSSSRQIPNYDDNTNITGNKQESTYTGDAGGTGIMMAHNGYTTLASDGIHKSGGFSIEKGSLLFDTLRAELKWGIGVNRTNSPNIWIQPQYTVEGGSGSTEYYPTITFKSSSNQEISGSAMTYIDKSFGMSGRPLNLDIDFSRYTFGQYCTYTSSSNYSQYGSGTMVVPEFYNGNNYGNGNTTVWLRDAAARRRVFSETQTIGLTIHTANDNDASTALKSGSVWDKYIAVLNESTGVYDSMRPQVSIVAGQGGVTSSGNLYVGSKLKVSLQNTASYSPAAGTTADYTVYITDSDGNKLPAKVEAEAEENSDAPKVYYVTLMWDDMKTSDLSKSMTLHVVMQRKQTVTVDLASSMPGTPSANQIAAAWKNFICKADGTTSRTVTFGYSEVVDQSSTVTETASPTRFLYTTKSVAANDVFKSDSGNAPSSATFTLSKIYSTNLQWINFGQDADDTILINGTAYKGNENVYLTGPDLAMGALNILFIDAAYASVPTTMKTAISQTALYFDSNGDGKINGWYNQETGYFVLDTDEGGNEIDSTLGFVSGDFDESFFQPVVDSAGNVHQYFLKVFYSATPRCIRPPAGAAATDTTAILPAFVSSITDSSEMSKLTTQQKGYLYVQAAQTRSYADNKVTPKDSDYSVEADTHLVYGAAANKISVVDIPLGGDTSPATANRSATTGKVISYSWTPNFKGNLRFPFASPEAVYVPHSLAGDNVRHPAYERHNMHDGSRRADKRLSRLHGWQLHVRPVHPDGG